RIERLLALAEPEESTLDHLQRHVTDELGERPIVEGLRGERAGFSFFLNGLASRDPRLATYWKDPLASLPGWLSHEHAEYLRWMNRAIALAGRPFVEQPAAWAALATEVQAAFAQANQSPLRSRLKLVGLILLDFQ